MSWKEYEKEKKNKIFKKKIDDARIYYIIGKTEEAQKILYIGSTKQNVTNRIKFNHRGFVKALREGWDEQNLGLSFGFYDEPLVLPEEVEGYLINKYKPVFNASTPNFDVVSNINEIGEFNLPNFANSQYGLIDKSGDLFNGELKVSLDDIDIEWMRYLESLPDEDSNKGCLVCNKKIDDLASGFGTNLINFKIKYDFHIKARHQKTGPEGLLKYFVSRPDPRHIRIGNERVRRIYEFQVPNYFINKKYNDRKVHVYCSDKAYELKNEFINSLPTINKDRYRYNQYIELMENKKELSKVRLLALDRTVEKFYKQRLIELNKAAIDPEYFQLIEEREKIKESRAEKLKIIKKREKILENYKKELNTYHEKYGELIKARRQNEEYMNSSFFKKLFMDKPDLEILNNDTVIPDPPVKPQMKDLEVKVKELPPLPNQSDYLSKTTVKKNKSIAKREIRDKLQHTTRGDKGIEEIEDKEVKFYYDTLNRMETNLRKKIQALEKKLFLS